MMKNEKLYKVTIVLSKLCEVGHWIGAVGMIVGLVGLLVGGTKYLDLSDGSSAISVYSLEVQVVDAAGQPNVAAVEAFCVAAAVCLALMAMVFRNVHLILKKSEGTTPFQPDNVRMVREIGIFLLAVPVVGMIFSIIARLLLGPEVAEVSVNMSNILIALVVLCLSQIFARGMELETDVDGLL